ncbi:MAG: hypothetical protein ACRD29_04300 [Acidimicrobiales bacterium]
MGERQVWNLVVEQVQAIDLLREDGVDLVVEGVEIRAYRLASVGLSVVDGMERGHGFEP